MSVSDKKEPFRLVLSDRQQPAKRSRASAIQELVPGASEPLAELLAEVFDSTVAVSLPVRRPGTAPGQRPRRRPVAPTAEFDAGLVLKGAGGCYRIRKLLRRGEHCNTYLGEIVSLGSASRMVQVGGKVVIKTPRVPDDMSDDVAARRLGTLVALFDRESEDLQRLESVSGVARFLDRGEYAYVLRSASRPSVFVVQEYVEGQDLRQYLQAHFAVDGRFSGIRDAKDFFAWARRLTNTLHEIHGRLVVHGSICPDNIRVNLKKQPIFVDFGEALFEQVMDDTACFGGRPALCRAPERAWGVGDDLYSLGGVLYYLATGDDPPQPYEDIEVLKQQVRNRIRINNEPLFKTSYGVADIVARCLRYSRAGRVENAAGLLGDIDTFDVAAVSEDVTTEVKRLLDDAKDIEASGHSMLRWMGVLKVRELEALLRDMARGSCDLTGSADDMRGSAARLMSILDREDEFVTISVPSFWYPENIGIDGRFMSKNMEAVQRGVSLRRVFLIDEAFTDEHLEEIVAAHLRISVELGYPSNYSVRFRMVSASERDRFIRAGRHFGLFLRRGSPTAMFPQYRTGGTLQALRFRTDQAIVGELKRVFEQEFELATPLADLTLPVMKVV